jgi:hypothetical protein
VLRGDSPWSINVYLAFIQVPNVFVSQIRSSTLRCDVKSKAVPLHAMEAPGGIGGIAPTRS